MAFVNCFGNNPGYNEPVVDAPQTLDELLGCFDEVPEDTVWRGQACRAWSAIPTLHRRLRRSGLSDCQINEGVVNSAERRILADAIEQGDLAKDGSVFEFMARLRRHR